MRNIKFEKAAIKLIRKYQKILYLDIHNIVFTKAEGGDNEFAMDCAPRYPYLSANITYNDKVFKAWEAGDLEEYVVHELLHIITAPLDAKAKKRYTTEEELDQEEERLVDTLARIILNLANNGRR